MNVRIGDRGVATTPLRPGGFVTIVDVRHSARSQAGFVDAAMEVVVVGGDNQGLIVRSIHAEVSFGELPGHGDVVYSSFGDKIQTRGKDAQERLALQRKRQVTWAWRFGAGWGLLCAIAAVILLRGTWALMGTNSFYSTAALIVVGSVLWGAIVGRVLFGAFEQIEQHPRPILTMISAAISLTGGAMTLVALLPNRGVATSIVMTFCASVVLGLGLLAMGAISEWLAGNGGDGSAETPGDES